MFDYVLFIVIKKADFTASFSVRYNRLCSLATVGFADAVSYIDLFNAKIF